MSKHSRTTRLIHMSIAFLVVMQLLSSIFMTKPNNGEAENLFFEWHEYSGIATFNLIFLFWIYTLFRRKGTSAGLLFPWFSKSRRKDLKDNTLYYIKAFRNLRVPDHHNNAALPSAIHGLGILLIMAMGITGVSYFAAMSLSITHGFWLSAILALHAFFSKFVWAYLIGHATIAVINHFAKTQSINEMWSLKK